MSGSIGPCILELGYDFAEAACEMDVAWGVSLAAGAWLTDVLQGLGTVLALFTCVKPLEMIFFDPLGIPWNNMNTIMHKKIFYMSYIR